MSNYGNFFSDFPGRLRDILADFEQEAKIRNRDVTLMLAAATPSIIVPCERLSDPHDEAQPHPSGDHLLFPKAKARWDEMLQVPFLHSELWPSPQPGSWKFGRLASVEGEPDQWLELTEPRALSAAKLSRSVIRHLRNGLAHGNIFTLGHPEITTIVILSRVSIEQYRFNYICVSPFDFRTFLFNWLDFVGFLPGAREVIEWRQHETIR